MIAYKYSVLDENNNIVKGEVEAFSQDEAKDILLSEGYKIIRLNPNILSKGYLAGNEIKNISSQEIALFCKQLNIITKSGISILKGLLMIRSQTDNKRIRQLCENIYMRIQKGYSLSNAFKNSGYRLPLLLINMVEIGEISGNLDEMFKKLADYYEKDASTRKKVSNAMIYPIILVCIAVGVISLFSFFVLPQLVGIIKETGGVIPTSTQILLDSTQFILHNFHYITLGIILFVIFYIKIVPYSIKFKIKNFISFKIPAIRVVSKDFVTARFLRTMGILVKTGLPMIAVLETLENAIDNEIVSKGISEAKEKINNGESLSSSLAQISFFDSMVTNIITIGEETGNLETCLLDMAEYYDEKFDSGVSKLISSITPIFTLIMGVVIGAIVLMAMLPMFNMVSSLSNIRDVE